TGLYESLIKYLNTYEKQYQITASLKTTGKEQPIPSETKIFIFRIIQEALANVQKHSEASKVVVQVGTGKGILNASIVDNGVGFHPVEQSQPMEKGTSFGLKVISERARLLGGSAKITSRKKVGTRVIIQVPLKTAGESLEEN
ncbi:MAG: sensor histidine kinase, partial [Nitrospiria bacterium]